jgi:hypothetical protein
MSLLEEIIDPLWLSLDIICIIMTDIERLYQQIGARRFCKQALSELTTTCGLYICGMGGPILCLKTKS